ncbi:MAG: transglutaminase-like domain-containing protein [Ruminococcus sp.]|jgi:transglutaminase-like putative cysteine protease|nr:transglutaminase-like domain-containing protein [Ruminococcus sp.]
MDNITKDTAEVSGKIPSKLINYFFPFAFSVTVVLAFTYAYTEEILSGWSLLTISLVLLFFFVIDRIAHIKNKPGIPFFALSMFVLLYFSEVVVRSGNSGANFLLWFFSGNVIEPTRPVYLAAFIPAFSFFVSSTVYYFAIRIYRKHWLLVIALLPFTAFVKLAITPPAAFVIIIAALGLFIYLQNTRKVIGKHDKKAGGKSVFVVYADFALALVLAAAIFPKPSQAPYYEDFTKLLGRFSLSYRGEDSSGRLSLRSGNADNFNRGETRLLYFAELPEFDYLKLQSYPYYNGEEDFWYISNEAADFGLGSQGDGVKDYEDLTKAINAAVRNDRALLSRYGLTPFDEANIDPLYEGEVIAAEYSSVFAPSPSRTTAVEVTGTNTNFYTLFGGGILTDRFLPQNVKLDIDYYSPYIGNMGYYDSLQNLSYDEYQQFLLDVMSSLPGNSEEALTVRSFFAVHTEAMNWRSFNTYQSESLRKLALEITEGKTTLTEKAAAIESYFSEEDFTYILGYDAENDSPENFVFNDKIGTCSDFATAYALLAGYAGLSVRYTEGYIPREIDDIEYITENFGSADSVTDYYEITSDDAHAYPEVYINGLWRRFEPTVSALYGRDRNTAADVSGDDDALTVAYAIAFGIIGVLAVIIILLRPAFAEMYFRMKVLITEKTQGRKAALILIFSRINYILGKRQSYETVTKTPDEIAEYAKIIFSANLNPIAEPLNKAVYGGLHITREEITSAYESYKINYAKVYKRNSSAKHRKSIDFRGLV